MVKTLTSSKKQFVLCKD